MAIMKYSSGWKISKEFESLSMRVEQSTPKEQQLNPQLRVNYKQIAQSLIIDFVNGKEVNYGMVATIGNQRKCL